MVEFNPVSPMKSNVGSYDAAVRFIGGLVMIGIGAHFSNWWGLLGLAPIASAAFAFCPLYLPLRIDTTFTDRPHDPS